MIPTDVVVTKNGDNFLLEGDFGDKPIISNDGETYVTCKITFIFTRTGLEQLIKTMRCLLDDK